MKTDTPVIRTCDNNERDLTGKLVFEEIKTLYISIDIKHKNSCVLHHKKTSNVYTWFYTIS